MMKLYIHVILFIFILSIPMVSTLDVDKDEEVRMEGTPVPEDEVEETGCPNPNC